MIDESTEDEEFENMKKKKLNQQNNHNHNLKMSKCFLNAKRWAPTYSEALHHELAEDESPENCEETMEQQQEIIEAERIRHRREIIRSLL